MLAMLLSSFVREEPAFPVFKVESNMDEGQYNNSQIHPMNNPVDRKKRMELIVKAFESVMNDKDFQKELLQQKFVYDVDDDPNKKLTTAEVAEKIYAAVESYTKEGYEPKVDNTANIYWDIKRRPHRPDGDHATLGYGFSGGYTIYTYSWYFRGKDIDERVGHLAHEWSHKLGFRHRSDFHKTRDETVPYAFGYLVRKHAKKYLPEE
ncbi:hypothetical protein K3G63_06775 [Hymenobacter sp. HSC-4F20]|nr:hypothetical protein [Hymenobacter sp. HSC-4F20]